MPYARHPFRCDYYPGAVLATDPIQKGLLHKAVLLRGVVEITPGENEKFSKIIILLLSIINLNRLFNIQ